MQSLQYIAPDGTKRFLTGGKVQGGQFVIPGKAEKPPALCEGYATGASIHLACAWTVHVTFSAGNLSVVAAAVRKQFPSAQILICGDTDETGRDKFRAGHPAGIDDLLLVKAVRKDAVHMCGLIVTSDSAFFKSLLPEETRRFFEESKAFLAAGGGKATRSACRAGETGHLTDAARCLAENLRPGRR